MEAGPAIGIIYGIILIILGGLGIYALDYLHDIQTYTQVTAYLLIILGIISLIAGTYFAKKK